MRRLTLICALLAVLADAGPTSAEVVGHAARACRAPHIDSAAFKPAGVFAGGPATLRVKTSLPGGRVYAVDVLWGQDDKRDHFTLAPSLRRASYTFVLRHTYGTPGLYRATVKTYGIRGGCKRVSKLAHPSVRALAA